ncbi:unnamed protein product [marine sediment metagenome]|uniref:Cytochrome c domain-containing protein n=1 Tax=marine sediment metagenome TaxID=412755 RepID=X0T7Y0_9ZZZZ
MPRLACTLVLVLMMFAGSAVAQNDEAYVGYRQTLMEGIGSDMAAINDILKYDLPLTRAIQGHARSMAALAELVPAAFQHRTSGGASDAKPSVWDDKMSFERASNELIAAARKLLEVADLGEPTAIGNQVQAVGKTCGDCHESFRKPEAESFKRSGLPGDTPEND